ncbi:hypothetical protein [Legionella fairfieldensis]|uniref:hypothetical protein n=1 Tax=Legionella fairfieldensis TaxID=45064 RepID=UPI000688826A|nr:hypothetical protein [Legionella fairfieldensis]
MQARAFNSISINREKNILTKSSKNKEKLGDEISYYLDIPDPITDFFPRLINFKTDFSAYYLEYLPYNSLEDLILKGKISLNEGKIILRNLLNILEEIHQFKPDFNISNKDIANFYIKKTKERIIQLTKIDYFKSLLANSHLKINGKMYKNFFSIENIFSNQIIKFTKKYHKVRVIHGDFCFSNILYCPQKRIIKLIDPRGSFIYKGIYGHNLYDYAKLMHCLHSRYDFLVNDQFRLCEETPNQFYFEIPNHELLRELEEIYIEQLLKKGIPLEFIYLIEASLFLSMASLHYENIERQKILYLVGIILLNQVAEGKYANMY